MSGVWGSHEVRGLPLGKVIQHFFFGKFKRYNMSSKAACDASNPDRIPTKIDPPNRLKMCYFGPPGVSRGGLERPGPPGGGVPTLFGRILGPSGGALGPPWGVLGRSWGALGGSWVAPGTPLGDPKSIQKSIRNLIRKQVESRRTNIAQTLRLSMFPSLR